MNSYTESFERGVRECLSHMYDFTAMQDDPVVRQLVPHLSGLERIQTARKILIETIEQLNQRDQTFPGSRQSRVYSILLLRYVEEQPVPTILDQLALSERQFYRELNRAVQVISQLLWDHLKQPNEDRIPEVTMSVQTEIQRVSDLADTDSTDLHMLLMSAHQFTSGLADRYGVTVQLDMPDDPMIVYAAEPVLKQTVICLLSETIKNLHGGGKIQLQPCQEKGDVVVCFTVVPYEVEFTVLREQLAHDDMIWSLVQAVGAELVFVPLAEQNLRIELRLPQHRCTLLVIDDNPDVIRLIERYVTQSQYGVIGVQEAMEGVELARRLQPYAIILDVMMPEYDGWEILQHLKNHPETRHIPVLICSVLDTPELAFSLGADYFIKKPPGRVDLLKVLAQMAK